MSRRTYIPDYLSINSILQNQPDNLTQDEEISLAQRIQTGIAASAALASDNLDEAERERCQKSAAEGKTAKDILVSHNYRLVYRMMRNFGIFPHNSLFEDLFQEGVLGLEVAAEHFQTKQDTRFTTYAFYWIRNFILRYRESNIFCVHTPVKFVQDTLKFNKSRDEIYSFTGEYPSCYEMSEMTDISYKTAKRFDSLLSPVISLDAEIPSADDEEEDSDSLLRYEIVADPDSPLLDEGIRNEDIRKIIDMMLSLLTEQEKQILIYYFGLYSFGRHTMEEVGMYLGISKEQVRQIKDQSMTKMRYAIMYDPECRKTFVHSEYSYLPD